MNSKFAKMLEKKRDMSPVEKHAKMSVLKDLKGAASEAAGDRLKHLKKVSVMSDNDEGLQHGLEKAREIAGDMPPGMHDGGLAEGQEFSYSDGGQVESNEQEDPNSSDSPNQMEEAMEALDEEDSRHEDPSAHEMHDEEGEYRGMDIGSIEDKIKHLMALRDKMGSK